MNKKCCVLRPARGKMCWIIILLFLSFSSGQLFGQSIRVAGVVRDTKGVPVPGANILVKGSSIGTTTDSSGRFAIDVASRQSVLVFSSVGFVEKEEKINDQNVINITLADKQGDMDEIVVIGYGQTVKKSNLTGAIASVNSKQIQERQPINLFDALQGQAAGVLIMNDNGEPGAQGSIQIRGANTFTADGNTPLYIVDGVLTDNAAAINPNDIERVEVLKDAASASIYGARSAAGVILITTKKGKEGRTRLDVQYSRVYGWLAHKIQAANADDLRYYRRLQNPNSATAGTFTDSLNPSFNTDNDLQELLLGNTGKRHDVKLGVNGGQRGLTYYARRTFCCSSKIPGGAS